MAVPSVPELEAMSLAWARAFPLVTIVPAFGLRALAPQARGVLALALAAAIYPSLGPDVAMRSGTPWALSLVEQVVLGLPVALAAAIPLWTATMAGGIADTLRGGTDANGAAVVEGRAGTFGVLYSMLASAVFLTTGGPARAAAALATSSAVGHPLLAAAQDIVAGITLAVTLGGPLLAAAVVLEITFALIARASSPAQVHALLAPLRSLGILAVVAITLERIATLVAISVRATP